MKNIQWNRSRICLIVALSASAAILVGFGVRSGAQSQEARPIQVKSDSKRIKALESELTSLAKRYETLSHDVNNLANFSPPIGSVTAFAGKWPEKGPERDTFEERIGWLLCDGRKLPYKIGGQGALSKKYEALASMLRCEHKSSIYGGTEAEGQFNVPDYRGYFLRGIVDKDEVSGKRDVEGVRTPGNVQLATTRLPTKPLVVSVVENHDHKSGPNDRLVLNDGNDTDDGKRRNNGGPVFAGQHLVNLINSSDINPARRHSHTISGGDDETRPSNVAVYWIIKFK